MTDIKMSEKSIERQILAYDYGDGIRLWKCERGVGYQGNVIRKGGSVIINKAQVIRFGLCNGNSDIIGFKMENGIARFVAIEVKTTKGVVSPEQQRFLDMVKAHGGIAGIARNVEDVVLLLGKTV